MLDIDQEESHQTGCSDSESEPPGFSSVNSTKIQSVNVCSPSVNQTHDRASFKCWDTPSLESAPYKGNPAGHVPLEGAESCKGEEILESPTHTTPRSKSLPILSCHRGWAMGRGRGVPREGVKNSTISTYGRMMNPPPLMR